MYLQPHDVRFCLDKAREVAEHYRTYHLNGQHVHRSVDGLVDVIRQYLNKNFEIRVLPLPKKSIKAIYIAAADDKYEIYLFDGLAHDEARFTLCKELFHIILDQPECRNLNLFAHLEEVASTFPVLESHPNPAASWEFLAEAAAMEFLFPYDERVDCLLENGGNPDFAVIAARYGIPRMYVEGYCGQQHMAYFYSFRA